MTYVLENIGLIARLFGEHLALTFSALAIALTIALPLGVLVARVKWLRGPVLGVLGTLYTIPTLSLFVLLIPILGLGTGPALTALVIYAQVVLVRNVVIGLDGIDPGVIESARGMGMSQVQRLLRVELPLALPLILAGVRVVTLSTIGIGTLAAFVNAGGLGTLLFDGVRSGNNEKIVIGALAVSLLAVAANGLFGLVERRAAI